MAAMRIACVGGGPAGLYAAILFKLANSEHDVVVYERNQPDDTFGFGVVFSDATLGNLEVADPETLAAIRADFAHWDAIDTHVGGEVIRSVGHGFCGLERKRLLLILKERAESLGVKLVFNHPVDAEAIQTLATEVDLLIAADGLSSLVRDQWKDQFGPDIDVRPNRFVWLGTTFPFQAFTFYFKDSPEGLWRIHAYRYCESGSTFIAECTAETFAATGLDEADEDGSIAYLENVFADELDGHKLVKNRSHWRQFPTVRNKCWHAGNVVLVGDAAHTAHFSIGSGTKLAMEDCIALVNELGGASSREEVESGLSRYEAARRPSVARLQAAAEVSLEWFETTERYAGSSPLAFTYSLMTRSLRVTHDSLSVRDAELAAAALAEFSGSADRAARETPTTLYDVAAESRVATLEDDALVLAGGARIPFGEREEGVYAHRIAAADVLSGAADLDALEATTRSPVVVIDIEPSGDARADHAAVARAADTVRNDVGVPVAVCLPGASPSFLDTLLLAGRADLGVL